MYSEDMADACSYLMNLPDEQFATLLREDRNDGLAPLVNIGVGHDLTIHELAETVAAAVGYEGKLEFDASKPDATPGKLMNVDRLDSLGWRAKTSFEVGLARAYADFLTYRK
jgi:GDP-L-fucose synthase